MSTSLFRFNFIRGLSYLQNCNFRVFIAATSNMNFFRIAYVFVSVVSLVYFAIADALPFKPEKLLIAFVFCIEMARVANRPVFGQSAKCFETVR